MAKRGVAGGAYQKAHAKRGSFGVYARLRQYIDL